MTYTVGEIEKIQHYINKRSNPMDSSSRFSLVKSIQLILETFVSCICGYLHFTGDLQYESFYLFGLSYIVL